MKSEDFGVTLELDENDELEIQPLGYWPGKPNHELLSPKAWDKQLRKLKIGKDGLKLTVIKPGGTKNKNITIENMIEVRKIKKWDPKKLPDLDKVILGAKFSDLNDMLDVSSDVILDKARYWIDIIDIPVRSICTKMDNIIFVDHGSNIKVSSFHPDIQCVLK